MRCLSSMLALLLLGAVLIGAEERAIVPEAEAQAKAEKIIKDLFKADYAKKSPADVVALRRARRLR